MDWQQYEHEGRQAVSAAATAAELDEARVHYLGRRSELTGALRGVRDRETGMLLNGIRGRLEAAVAEREDAIERDELDRALTEDVVDVTLPGEELPLGQLHPITQVRRQIEDTFLGLGYEIRYDREVETVEYNFDKLAFGPTHPARSPRDTFFLDERHGAAHGDVACRRSIRWRKAPADLHGLDRPFYRRDTIDATHYPIFHQFEGLAVDQGLTLADLQGDAAARHARALRRGTACPLPHPLLPVHGAVDGARRLVRRLRRRRLPDLQVHRLARDGRLRHGRPAVFENVGLDPEEWSGFAFGCGLERVAQLRHGIPEIRPLWEHDLRVLRQF